MPIRRNCASIRNNVPACGSTFCGADASQPKEKAKLRVELRGTAKGNLPSETTLETEVHPHRHEPLGAVKLDGEKYKKFGEVTAWRVTLWSGDQLIGEQKSFLW